PRAAHGRRALAWAAFTAGVLGGLLPLGHGPRLVGLLALVATVVLTVHRHRLMVWTAWVAVVPAAGLTAHLTVPWFAGLTPAAAVTSASVTVGGLLVLGAVTVAAVRHGWRPRPDPGTGG
ncbi:hypothetical protein, partial [Cellulomonas bogoriensis]|uniref:hypothetical protein n=1 Tax=Cellulomonas bogoriensis TaxID=301388 RepID=UPI00055828A9